MQPNKTGTLYVVATPIGNLQDITLRALEVLKRVDLIAAEDTRHSKLLLEHFSIHKPIFSLHDFNERDRVIFLLDKLQGGESVALISDAGTPLVSDPGFHLVKEAHQYHICIVPIPGPCAAIAALSVAGLPTDKFVFEGFLPAKQEARKQRLMLLRHECRTLIFYEAPHRLLSALQAMMDVFGQERRVVVARELTKIHESVQIGTVYDVFDYFTSHLEEQRGEVVILAAGSDQAPLARKEVDPEQVLDKLLAVLPLKQAAALTADITGERKNLLYQKALLKSENRGQKTEGRS